MRQSIRCVKLVGAGNDFILVDGRVEKITRKKALAALAVKICDRNFGLGADGLLVIEGSKKADARMRTFNADGSEAEMCGNALRCFAYYLAGARKSARKSLTIETVAGLIQAHVHGDRIKAKLTAPKDLKLDIPLAVSGRVLKVSFINTGVPHAVIRVQGLGTVDVEGLGRLIRFHEAFKPAGTNVDFYEVMGPDAIRVRTYERGVEAETLACGTGSTAAALVSSLKLDRNIGIVNVLTQSKEVLKVHFTRTTGGFRNVWMEGQASLVWKGEYYG